jgi:hypothetical protein
VDAAEVIGVLLERGGMTRIEIERDAFRPPAGAGCDEVANAFARHALARGFDTQCAVFSEFVGTPGTGVAAVNTVLVNRQGQAVFVDSQTADQPDFRRLRPDCPMTCCLLVIERLQPVLELDDPNRADAPQGPLARSLEARSGLPGRDERDAIERRQAGLKAALANGTMTVLGVGVNEQVDEECARNLTRLLSDAGLARPTVVDNPVVFDAEPTRNQQQRLWEVARAFRMHVRDSRPDSDYALYAEYLISPRDGHVRAVHFFICDRQGEWVVVDFQNDHHADFKRVDPGDASECDRLVVERLERYTKGRA